MPKTLEPLKQNNLITFLQNCFNKETKVEKKLILHNDDFVSAEDVVCALCTVTNKSTVDAVKIMMEAHNSGRSLIGSYTEDKCVEYQREFALYQITTTVED